MATYDAFVASAPEDGLWVRRLAARLKALDIDVFLDELHVAPGEVVIHRIEEALLSSATAILVCSRTSMQTPQVRDEYAAMVIRAGEGLQRLIPVVLHDVVIPPLVASRGVIDFREAASGSLFDAKVVELAKAIVHGGQGPDWLTLSPEAIRDRFVVRGPRSAHLVAGGDSVALEVDGRTTRSPHRFDPDRFNDLLWSLDQARDSTAVYRGPQSSTPTESLADVALRRIGTYLGETFLTGSVGEALSAEIDIAKARGASLRFGVHTSGGLPATLPWEMIIPPGRTEPVGLDPAIEIYRETAGLEPTSVAQVSAPLRVLAVLAAPDDDDDLDLEDEQRRLYDAFESTRRGAGVHVRVLDEGTLDGIRDALSGQEFHILHLACHARPGRLRLESEGGTAAEVEASVFVAALPPNQRPPLVVLSGCSTALDGDDLQDLARALIAAGVPQVLAMTAVVSDMFAREFCELFYRELALAQRPEALPALARARQLIEGRRPGDMAPEWATPALFLRGTSFPLYTLAEPEAQERLATITDPYLGPDIPLRAVGCFVGRRFDLRVLVPAFRTGRGVLIHGIGGVGKSSLAAELLRRLREDAGLIVAVVGRADPDAILTAVADALFAAAMRAQEDESTLFRRLSAELRLTNTPWRQRLDALVRILFPATRITLLLDNADVNATIQPTGSASLDDAGLAEFLSVWVTAPGDSRLVLTSRVPIALDGLHLHHLGPLSFSETRRLMWRLPALRPLPATDQSRAYLNVGGHPRTMEILDALLRRGATDFAGVRRRLEELLRQRGVGDPGQWMAEIGDSGLDTALAEAITLTTHDSLLESLLGLVAQDDFEVLVGLSVCEIPADFYLIKTMLIDGGEATLTDRFNDWAGQLLEQVKTGGRLPDEPPGAEAVDEEKVAASLQRMTSLGLVNQRVVLFASFGLPVAEGVDRGTFYSVHPWTAERVRSLHPDRAAVAHRRLAYTLAFRASVMTDYGRRLGDAARAKESEIRCFVLARRHAHAAGEIDFAIMVLYLISESLMNMGWYDLLERLYQETYAWTANAPSDHMVHNRINMLLGLSQISVARGHYPKAENYARQALELVSASHDLHRAVLHQLGESYLFAGQHDRAAATFRSIIDLMAKNDGTEERPSSLGLAYYGLGRAEQGRNLDIAEPMLRRALELFEGAEDWHNGAKAKHSLGNTAAIRGDLDTANRFYHEALEVFLEVGDRICTVRCYGELGAVAQRLGQLSKALDYQRRALTLAEQIGDTDGIQRARGKIAELMRERGSRDLEVDNRRRALNQALDVENVDDARREFMALAETLDELGDQEQLAALVAEGRKFLERAGDPRGLISAYTWTGRLAEAAGNAAEAKSFYLRALSRAREANADVQTMGNLLLRLGSLTERENPGQAVNFYRSALDLGGDELTADSVRQLGTKIVGLTVNQTVAQLRDGRRFADPHQLASAYADLAVNLAHLPGQERAAMIHRISAHFVALGVGSAGQAEWQRLLLAADVQRVGRNVVPANRDEFIAALTAMSGNRYEVLFRMHGHEGIADMTYEALVDGLGPSIAELLPPHLGIKWLPPVAVAVAATVMVSEGRRDEYEKHLRPVLDKQATDDRARRVVTAIKHRIAGEDWRPPLPCDLTYLVIALLEQELASFLEMRSEHADEPAEGEQG